MKRKSIAVFVSPLLFLAACGDPQINTENVTNETAVRLLDSLQKEVEATREDLESQEHLPEEVVQQEIQKTEERERYIREGIAGSSFAGRSGAQIDSIFDAWLEEYSDSRSPDLLKRICEAMQDQLASKHYDQHVEKRRAIARRLKELTGAKGRLCDGV